MKWLRVAFVVFACVGAATACIAAPSARWTWEHHPDFPNPEEALCRALVERLNSLPEHCEEDAIETYPDFREPPWTDLDPREHVALIAELLRYRQEGPRRYWSAASGNAKYRDQAEKFIRDGGRLQMWRTRLVSVFNYRPAPPGEQTVVQLSSYVALQSVPQDCPGKSSHGWVRALFLVKPDLSGPDPQVDAPAAYVLLRRMLVLQRGRPLLVNTDTVFRDFSNTGLHSVCSFKKSVVRAME